MLRLELSQVTFLINNLTIFPAVIINPQLVSLTFERNNLTLDHITMIILHAKSSLVANYQSICLFSSFFQHTYVEGTASYSCPLLATAEGFGLWPRLFFVVAVVGQKKNLYMQFLA